MIISQPCFLKFTRTNPNSTFLRFTNIVSNIKKAKYLVLDNYRISEFENNFKYFEKLLEQNSNLEIVVDCSTEILTSGISFLLNTPYASRILVISNGTIDNVDNIALSKSKIKQIREDFFIKYYDYYSPHISAFPNKRNKYLLLTGKPKHEREVLLTKLYKKNLLKYGNISYFGKEVTCGFNYVPPIDENSYWSFYLKEVEEFKSSLNSNLVVDVQEWNHNDSHARFYNADPYMDVEFVVVVETHPTAQGIFHTEKSTKPVQLNKKFILLNRKGALRDLKHKFLKYHHRDICELTDWVDTSYDDIDDLNERIDYIVDIIENQIHQVSTT